LEEQCKRTVWLQDRATGQEDRPGALRLVLNNRQKAEIIDAVDASWNGHLRQ
jgi:hypothetical protein